MPGLSIASLCFRKSIRLFPNRFLCRSGNEGRSPFDYNTVHILEKILKITMKQRSRLFLEVLRMPPTMLSQMRQEYGYEIWFSTDSSEFVQNGFISAVQRCPNYTQCYCLLVIIHANVGKNYDCGIQNKAKTNFSGLTIQNIKSVLKLRSSFFFRKRSQCQNVNVV